MKIIKSLRNIFVVLTIMLLPIVMARAGSPKDQLKQYVSDLQNDPSNQELREKIIKLAKKVKPSIPEEARGNFIKGQTLMKDPKDKSDYEQAITDYNQALLVAPWWGKAYRSLAIALKGDEQYEQAENALKLYVATGPKDARDAQDEIYVIDAKKDQAVKQAAVEKERTETLEGEWLPSIGAGTGTVGNMGHLLISRLSDGSYSVKDFSNSGSAFYQSVVVDGNNISFHAGNPQSGLIKYNFTLINNGETLQGTQQFIDSDGSVFGQHNVSCGRVK